MALPPDQLTPEAAQYEAMLQGKLTTAQPGEQAVSGSDGEVLPDNDSAEKRRQFDDRLLHLGVTVGIGVATPAAGVLVELNVWDRLAVGTEAAISLWGPAAALHLRGRPLVWGGRKRGVLSALTVQASYRYMAYGEEFDGFLGALCHADCDRPSFVAMPVHFLVLQVGLEHAFAGGFTLGYAGGAALQLIQPAWRCRVGRQDAPCADEKPPTNAFFVTMLTLSHSLP